MTIKADCIDDAEEDAKAIIEAGVVSIIDNEDREPLVGYDVTDSDPAEVD